MQQNKHSYAHCFMRLFIGTILLISLPACDEEPKLSSIEFKPVLKDAILNCQEFFTHHKTNWQLNHLQLFIHAFELKDTQNNWHPAQLKVGSDSSQKVALVGGVCGADLNWELAISSPVPESQIQGIRFQVGVPFELNHHNPLQQPSPLNQSDMFWTWRMGYKFARIELVSPGHEWIFHLGSTGCDSPTPVRPPETACKNPNRPNIELNNFKPGDKIAIDLAGLIGNLDMLEHNNCQSMPGTPACEFLLPRMGIGAPQQVFKLLP